MGEEDKKSTRQRQMSCRELVKLGYIYLYSQKTFSKDLSYYLWPVKCA